MSFQAIEVTAVLCEEAVLADHISRVRELIEWCLNLFRNWAVDNWIEENDGWVRI